MKKIFCFFIFLFFSICNSVFVFATTLKDALQLAYKNSDAVGMQYYKKDISKLDFYKSLTNFVPSVDVSYSFMPFAKMDMTASPSMTTMMARMAPMMGGGLPAGSGDNNYNNSHSVQASATLPLSFYKTIPGAIGANKNRTASIYEYDEFLENFGLLFIQKYMDVIFYTKAKKVYEQMSETYDKKLKKVTVMNAYGSAKRDKVVLAEAQLYENKANEITTNSSLDRAKMEYKIITGEEPDDLQIPDMSNFKLPVKTKQEFIDLVLENNSGMKKLKKQYEAQKYAMTTQSLSALPDLFVSYSYMYMKGNDLTIKSNYIGVGASWSFNGRGKPIIEARKSYTNYRIAGLNIVLKKKELEQDAGYNWDQYFASVELVKATEKALKASRDSLKEVKISVSTGTATFIDEMDIETQYLNANLNYLKAQKALILSYYKLISMTGVGMLTIK